MGYFMRFFITDDKPISIDDLLTILHKHNNNYRIGGTQVPDLGALYLGDLYLGELEISRNTEEIFTEEINEFHTLINYSPASQERDQVLNTLDITQVMVVMEAYWEGENDEPVLEAIDPLWDGLFERHSGLFQMDDEGFFDSEDMVFEMNTRI